MHFRRLRFDEARGFERERTGLTDSAEELTGRNTQAACKREDGRQRGIALTVLDGPDVIGRQRRTLGELL